MVTEHLLLTSYSRIERLHLHRKDRYILEFIGFPENKFHTPFQNRYLAHSRALGNKHRSICILPKNTKEN